MSTASSLGNLAPLEHGARAAGRRDGGSSVSLGLVLSLLLHLALVVVLVTRPPAKGVPKPQKQRLVTISLDALRESGKPSAQAVAMPAPKEPPKLLPVPVPPQAQAAPKKPAPPKQQPQRSASPPQPPQATPKPAQASTAAPAQKHGEEGESPGLTMLGRVRENWLRPAHSAASFHCRLRIDYLAGGAISNVVLMEGCGDGVLDDSVERAIWKTQPLPLGPAQQGPGTLVLDFTP